MKKIISVLLVLAMFMFCLVACGGGEDNGSGEESIGSSNKTNEFMDADGNYVPRHEVKDMQGRNFSIIVRGEVFGTYQSDDFTTNSQLYGELIDDAVQRRNDVVERLYNVTLVVNKSDDIDKEILLDCQSSLGNYDAIMPSLSNLSNLASQGYLYDLRSIEAFDDEAPWYDENCSKAFSINNQLHFTTGDITILNKVNTPSILFNKEMAAKYFPETDFYQLVRDKEWTFDVLLESAKKVASIVTSDGSYSDDNIYGMVTTYNDTHMFYGASGELICGKDSNDLPYLQMGQTDRSVTIAQKILSEYSNADWLIHAEECEAPIWETSFAIFYEGRALFRPSAFSATTKLRKLSEIEFGVLPYPLMDSTQTEYFSYCSTGATAGIAIPISAKDPEYSAYMIEAYSAWAKNYLTKAYYEVNLRYKDLRDDESEEMLDIIFSNIVYDMGLCYNFGGLATMMKELCMANSTDVVSTIEGKVDQAQTKINELIEMYANQEE